MMRTSRISAALLILLSGPAFAMDLSSANGGLPAVYKRVGATESYTCMVVPVRVSDHRLDPFFGREISLDDIGGYAVLADQGASAAGRLELVGSKAFTEIAQASAVMNGAQECGAGLAEVSAQEALAALGEVAPARALASEGGALSVTPASE